VKPSPPGGIEERTTTDRDSMTQILSYLFAFALALVPGSAAHAEAFDTEALDRVLQRYTRSVDDTAGVRVDYAGLARSDGWRGVVANLEAANPDLLATRNAKLAFWINAYNILAIDLVVKNPGIKSIRDLGNFVRPVWKRTAGRVGGRGVSLAEIEHETLRPMGEARIHGALVCASLSCPPLKRTAWSAEDLDAEFDATLRAWLADPTTGLRVDREDDVLYLSRVFEWFEDDFAPSGGVLAFIEPYLGTVEREWLVRHPGSPIRYLPYDWNLNRLADSHTRE